MQQICYASQSTSVDKKRLLVDLREILTEARHFNYQHDISGVLYFADGYFFQCLEGKSAVLQILVEKLLRDPRHHQVRLFEPKQIEAKQFDSWSMKFVGRHSRVQSILNSMGFEQFTPRLFDQHHVENLLSFLREVDEMDVVQALPQD